MSWRPRCGCCILHAFITEELWQTLKQKLPANSNQPESIMIAAYPSGDEKAIDPEAEHIIETVIEIVHSIRNARAEHKVESNKWIEAHIYAGDLAESLESLIIRPFKLCLRPNRWKY